RFSLLKHKFLELLCIRSEAGLLQSSDLGVDDMVACLNALEQCSPSREQYNELCLLLTFPRLCDHLDYKHWNPSNARINCFKEICPLVEKLLPSLAKSPAFQRSSSGDRLVQLLIKGILYESCVNLCQKKAISPPATNEEPMFTELLGSSDADLSLFSWLECLPPEVFSYPFEQKVLNVDIQQLVKPFLEASWTEQILATPIKPRVFPHSAVPRTPMSRSLIMASMDGGLFAAGTSGHPGAKMAMSMADLSTSMSRSFGGFHLTGKKLMNTSVDRLFEAGDVFSTSCMDIRTGTLPGLLKEEEEEGGENGDKSKLAESDKSEFWKEFQRLKRNVHHNSDIAVGTAGAGDVSGVPSDAVPTAGKPTATKVETTLATPANMAPVPVAVASAVTTSVTPQPVPAVSSATASKNGGGTVTFKTSTPRVQRTVPSHVMTVTVDGVPRKLENEFQRVDICHDPSDSSVHSESLGSLRHSLPQPSSANSARVLINTVS
ncbi:unnamed protein product, partial [Ixodes hexagonus]